MDETPKGLLAELRTSVLKKRIGQIALAVVLAEALLQLVTALTWYLIIPVIARILHGQTESVLFAKSAESPIRWEMLFGSLLVFVLTLIVVLYLNRWIQRKPKVAIADPEAHSTISDDEPPIFDTTGGTK
jgi:large-conductance mechanosensitive channel